MFVRDLKDCGVFLAGDATGIQELLHPDKEKLDLPYSLAHALLKPGQTSRPHRMRSTEVYFILAGQGRMHIEDESAKVRAGQVIWIPPSARQFIENTGKGDLRFLCLVSPPWRAEDEEGENENGHSMKE